MSARNPKNPPPDLPGDAIDLLFDEIEGELHDRINADVMSIEERLRRQLVQEIVTFGPSVAYFDELKSRARDAMRVFIQSSPADVGNIAQAQLALKAYVDMHDWLAAHLPGAVLETDAPDEE